MGKSFYYLFSTLLIVSLCISCRKGENDPLLSLRTRKARLTGDWILEEGTTETNYMDGSSTVTYITKYTSSSKEVNDNGNVSKTDYSQRLTLLKDNSFERETIENSIKSIHYGSWSFVNKNKDQNIKNKESILLSIDSYTIDGVTTVNEGVFASEYLLMDRLSNKKLIFKGETKRNFTSGENEIKKYQFEFEKQS